MPKLLSTLYLLLCALISIPEISAQVNFHDWTLAQTRQQASAQDRLFFLYFTADWCAPCRWMESNTLQNRQLTEYVAKHYLAVEVNIDQGTAALVRKQFTVEDIPSILVFSASGQLIDRHQGTISASDLQTWLSALNQPVHHLDAVQDPAASTTTLSSPRPQLGFSRPALGRSQSLRPAALSQAPSPSLILAGEPIVAAAASETFVPRDGSNYAVVLTDTSYTYEEAISAVAELERKYRQRTELQLQADGRHRLVLGEFTRRQAAQEFLIYLQRNDRRGEILTLGR